jgi:hypothetical protein
VRTDGDPALQREILETWGDWYEQALETYTDLEPGGPSAATRAHIAQARAAVRAARERAVQALP